MWVSCWCLFGSLSLLSFQLWVVNSKSWNISSICPIEPPNQSLHNKQHFVICFFINNFIKRIYIPRKFTLLKNTTQWVVGYSQCRMYIHPRSNSSKTTTTKTHYPHQQSLSFPSPSQLSTVCLFWTVLINEVTIWPLWVPHLHCSCDHSSNTLSCDCTAMVWLHHICHLSVDGYLDCLSLVTLNDVNIRVQPVCVGRCFQVVE